MIVGCEISICQWYRPSFNGAWFVKEYDKCIYHIIVAFLCFVIFSIFATEFSHCYKSGRHGRSYLPKLSHFSLFQAQGEVVLHKVYRKNVPKDNHFSSKLQKTVKTSPCIKFVGLPLHMTQYWSVEADSSVIYPSCENLFKYI